MNPERTAQSSSAAQRAAETVMLAALEEEFGPLLPRRITVGTAHVEIDGATEDASVLVEAYARVGQLKGGQPKKIAQDILKLALVKQQSGHEGARTIIAFASPEARASIAGWLMQAADAFGVELRVVELPPEVRADVLAAQARQNMVNPELPTADDAEAADPDALPRGQYGPSADYG